MRRIKAELLNLIPVATHATTAIVATVLLLPNPSPLTIATAALIGNLPDADTTYSHIGRLFYPLARILEARTGHRNATHSLAAVGLVATIAYAAAWYGWQPWSWWLWPTWYGSHLVLDMIIGGKSGVPLLWPAPVRFYLATIEGGSTGEKAILGLLLIALALAIQRPTFQPARILHERAGTLVFALQDYRNWEPWYHVLADIEATDQATHAPISGTFEIIAARGDTLTLRDLATGTIYTAGQRDEQLYIRRIVARRGPPRAPVQPAQPTPSVTPEYMRVIVENITDPAAQIKVIAGQYVTPGSILADYGPQPTATNTPIPTITPTPNQFPILLAANAVEQATLAATATAVAAMPKHEAVIAAKAKLALAERDLKQAQAAYDREAWRPEIGALPVAVALERATNAYRIAAAEATVTARYDRVAPRLALSKLEKTLIAATATAIAAQPRPINPTPSPPTPTPRPRYVRALASGLVTGWRIARADAQGGTVEIFIQLVADEPTAEPNENHFPEPTRAQSRVRSLPTVIFISAIDGDTIDVRLDGRVERIRLIGVDTPEITKGKNDCYGIEAWQFTQRFLQGKTLRIETDVQTRDRYGRLLAYIFADDIMLNIELARLGYARVKSYPPNLKHQTDLAAAEATAQANRFGMWGACDY